MDIIGPIILGVILIYIGILNRRGNISSVHWYHRKRVSEEDRIPFGRMLGLGTILCGISAVVYGCLEFAALKTSVELFSVIGTVLVSIGVAVGLVLMFYAMIKYNNGIF